MGRGCVLSACLEPSYPHTMPLPLSFLVPQHRLPLLRQHVMPLSLNKTSLYCANRDN